MKASAPNTIEETFELADALLKNDSKNICKELGDVMEHVIFYSMLGEEKGDFDVADVCNAQSDKLMFRHDFIDWTGWSVTRSDMVVNAAGQVVYKDEEEQAAKNAQSTTPNTASQVESTWEQRKQRDVTETLRYSLVCPIHCQVLLRLTASKTRHAMLVLIGKRKSRSGIRYMKN